MQQTETLSNNTPVTLSPTFQVWLGDKKAMASSHRINLLNKAGVLLVAMLTFLIHN